MPASAWRRLLLFSAVAGLLTPLAALPAHAAPPSFRSFTPVSLPTGLASGPDGNLWATSAAADSVMRITPGGLSEQFTAGIALGGDPLGITAGPDGNLWFVENDASRIQKQAINGNIVGTFPLPAGRGPTAIVAGPDGNLWFTESAGNRIGRVTTDGSITEFAPTPPDALSGPADIAAGADGNLWFTEPAANSIRQITPTGAFTQFSFFRDNAQPLAITAGPDGNLWFTESAFPAIGRIDPTSGAARDFPVPSIASAITAGPDGRVWFTMANGSIGRITPAGVMTAFPVPTTVLPAGTTFSDLRTGPDANLWAATSNGKLLRITTGVTPPRFTDSAIIRVPGTGDSGIADPYPATIEADGLQGTVTKVTVRLNGVHHGFASDIHAQLVGPQGQSAVLMANPTDRLGDVGLARPDVFDGEVLTFSDGAPAPPRRPSSGVFAPFNPGFLLAFEPPAPPNVPAPPASLAVFNGTNPNGAWKLFLVDDDGHTELVRPTTGVIAGGWSLDIETTGPPPVQLPAPPPVQLPAPDPIIVPGPTVTVAGQGAPAADTTRPTLKLGKLQTRMKLRDFRQGVRVQVTPSEPVTLDTTLSATPRTVFERTTKLSRAQTLVLKPSAKLLGAQKRTFKVRLRFVATDGAANRTTVSRTITVTR